MSATPDKSRLRVQLLLGAQPGARDDLQQTLVSNAERTTAEFGPAVRLCALTQIEADPFPAMNAGVSPFDAVVEFEGPTDDLTLDSITRALQTMSDSITPLVDPTNSGVALGWPQSIIPGPRCTLRYLYMMRRKNGLSRDDYFDHYFHRHSDFAFHLKGIRAYTQVHVDQVTSNSLTEAIGFGAFDIDSITELTFESVDEFFAGVEPRAAEASEDELRFVERDRSVSFCSFDHTVRAGATQL